MRIVCDTIGGSGVYRFGMLLILRLYTIDIHLRWHWHHKRKRDNLLFYRLHAIRTLRTIIVLSLCRTVIVYATCHCFCFNIYIYISNLIYQICAVFGSNFNRVNIYMRFEKPVLFDVNYLNLIEIILI